jgi:hypothetical protein
MRIGQIRLVWMAGLPSRPERLPKRPRPAKSATVHLTWTTPAAPARDLSLMAG